jgi:Ni,Fe-hydrogenase I large subunit
MIPAGLVLPAFAGVPAYNLVNQLVSNYVTALTIRREAHVLAAEVDGKHPCQNAQVPGGMTTQPSKVDWANVLALMTSIRTFINTVYIPDVLAVALLYGCQGLAPVAPLASISPLNYFTEGYGCGNLLAWGCCPQPNAPVPGTKLIDGGTVTIGPPLGGAVGPLLAINEALIAEDTASSHYSSPSGLHPSVGVTTPDKSLGYTWHKAPRYNTLPHEVGPLARMVATTLSANPTTVTDTDIAPIPGDTLGIMVAQGSPYPAIFAAGLTYNVATLVTTVLNAIEWSVAGAAITDYSLLMSILGRHGARALECKYLADALACHAVAPGAIPGPTAPGCTAGIPVINTVILDPNPGSDVYTYQVMPNSLSAGRGLTEAPRGALGHWVTTERRRIVNYQCVVPSTWNACGRDALGQAGPVEQSLIGINCGDPLAADPPGTTAEDVCINRILRAIHPFDICIACSVHLLDTKGKTLTKFRLDTDGKITKET